MHDLDHRVLYWNLGSERLHGWTSAEALGRRLDELVAPDLDEVQQALEVLVQTGEWHGELHHVDRTGASLILEGRWTLLRHGDGTPRAALAVNTDVTERRRVEAELLQALEVRATHDSLTGLPNREFLGRRTQEALDSPGGRDGGTVLMMCDLDDFKLVNDALGHGAGDQVLVEVARRMRADVRDRDLVARLGGDEFAILLQDADEVAIDARSPTDWSRRSLDQSSSTADTPSRSACPSVSPAPTHDGRALHDHASGQGRGAARAHQFRSGS